MPTRDILRQKLLDTPLYAEKIWKLSPEPWPITEAQLRDIKRIGSACLSYHRALERLYVRSFTNKKILRNREVYAPWVAEYLDRYKPAGLIAHGRHRAVKGQCPVVLRPDLLITDLNMPGIDGFRMISALASDPACANMELIAVTALGAGEIADRGGLPARVTVMTKPVPFDRLEQRVRAAVERHGATRTA